MGEKMLEKKEEQISENVIKFQELEQYTSVWGDTVSLWQLILSSIIGIGITMGTYEGVYFILSLYPEIPEHMLSGYSLIGGIAGCFLSGLISGRSFRPKREVIEGMEEIDLESVLEQAGTSVAVEAEALSKEDSEVIKEMEALKLYPLLALIPENSPNYKEEYRRYAGGSQE